VAGMVKNGRLERGQKLFLHGATGAVIGLPPKPQAE